MFNKCACTYHIQILISHGDTPNTFPQCQYAGNNLTWPLQMPILYFIQL